MFVHALLLAATVNPCAAAVTQVDMNACWANRAKQADGMLYAIYAKVTAGLHGLGVDIPSLADAQIAWIVMRDKTCAFETSLYAGGSIAPMISSECVARVTQARTVRLAAFLSAKQAGSVAKALPVDPKADAELNRAYGRIRAQVDAQQQRLFVNAESAWIAYRDKACALEGSNCATELTRERTGEIENSDVGNR